MTDNAERSFQADANNHRRNKRPVYADEKEVKAIFLELQTHFELFNHRVIDSLTAMSSICVQTCQAIGMSKPEFLGFVSNMWEMNDPENP
jgi:hypothetical protein